MALAVAAPGWGLPLSPGDRLRLFIPGEEGLPDNERFSATYEVNLDGTLKIPYLPPFQVMGLEVSQVEQQIRQTLIQEGFFQPQALRVSLQIFEWAPVQVTIAGAVYDPGRYLINNEDESKGRDLPAAIATVSGDYPPERYLTAAIRLAGGVRPNANLSEVRLIRGGQERLVDLSGVFTGAPVEDVPLMAGDQVIVPELARAQNDLVRPSQVTPATIRVFLSNLSSPRQGTNVQAQELPYGARFSQAVIAANCVGGEVTSRGRRAVLVQTNRTTGEITRLERSVEDLVINAADDTVNPHLMRDDSIVCYDSTVTNISNVFDTIGDILNPINLIRNIFFDN